MNNISDILEEDVCGTCKYSQYDGIERGWVCTNENSVEYANVTEYAYSCMEYRKKEDCE